MAEGEALPDPGFPPEWSFFLLPVVRVMGGSGAYTGLTGGCWPDVWKY